MKIMLFGYEYFCKRFIEQGKSVEPKNEYCYIDTHSSVLLKIKAIYQILTAEVIYIIGGYIGGSKVVDLGIFFKKKIVMHWVGTDVLNAKKDVSQGKQDDKYLQNIVHLCEVEWIKKELKAINIEATICNLATVAQDNEPNTMYRASRFSIFSYIGKRREEFYGINLIIKGAELFPDIEFRVCGTDGEGFKYPANIKFLGWISEMTNEYDKCSLFLRLPEHDGLGFSVIEALARGKFVGYSYSFPYTTKVGNINELQKAIIEARNQYNKGETNFLGVQYVHKNFAEKEVINAILENLYK